MKKLTVRAAEPKDSETYAAWLAKDRDINLVDPLVYNYPTCNTLAVEQDGEVAAMQSFHAVLMVEALAPKPGLTAKQTARATKKLFDTIEEIARISGIREVWFASEYPPMQRMVQRHGCQEVPYKVYRKRVK